MINYSNKYTFYGFFEILQIFISDDTCQIEKLFTYNLCFDWVDNSIDASPLVGVLGLSSDNAEALEDVDDIIYSSSLYAELLCTLIE